MNLFIPLKYQSSISNWSKENMKTLGIELEPKNFEWIIMIIFTFVPEVESFISLRQFNGLILFYSVCY